MLVAPVMTVTMLLPLLWSVCAYYNVHTPDWSDLHSALTLTETTCEKVIDSLVCSWLYRTHSLVNKNASRRHLFLFNCVVCGVNVPRKTSCSISLLDQCDSFPDASVLLCWRLQMLLWMRLSGKATLSLHLWLHLARDHRKPLKTIVYTCIHTHIACTHTLLSKVYNDVNDWQTVKHDLHSQIRVLV